MLPFGPLSVLTPFETRRTTLKRLRLLLMSAGALLGTALVLTAALLWKAPAQHQQALRCLPYFLLPKELVCAKNIYWINPDGSRVLMGKTAQLAPMPRPRPVQDRP